jgi:hypothetical protein
MTKACVLVFFQYFPRTGNQYKTQSTVFFNQVKRWANQINTFYIASGNWQFNWTPPNSVFYNEDMQSHWHYLNTLTSMVTEDSVLYLDPDILMYDPSVIERGFKALETNDVAGILDNSATLPLEKLYNIFNPNENRGVRRRFTPYLTFAKTELFKGLDFTPVPDKYDSMGYLTNEVMKKHINYFEFEDDRNTLRLEKDGLITKDTWLDGSPYLWSIPHDKTKDLGYYHVRNSSVGLSMLNEFQFDRPAYERRKAIMPFSEVMRLLAWQWIYDEAAGENWATKYTPVLNDLNVSPEVWKNYIDQIHQYYPWIAKL